MKTKIIILTGIVIGAIIGAAAPSYLHHRSLSQKKQCSTNLYVLYAAIVSTAMELGLCEGATPPPAKVAEYVKGGILPKCPSGNDYVVNRVGEFPTCPKHGNLLKEEGIDPKNGTIGPPNNGPNRTAVRSARPSAGLAGRYHYSASAVRQVTKDSLFLPP